MSEAHDPKQGPIAADNEPSGPNLKVAYSLLALALVVAFGIALFIVLPFYHRH
jgi:hypothetical protein